MVFFIAMTLAGKMYFDAVSKIGENAAVSPVSRELGECQFCKVLTRLPECNYFYLSLKR